MKSDIFQNILKQSKNSRKLFLIEENKTYNDFYVNTLLFFNFFKKIAKKKETICVCSGYSLNFVSLIFAAYLVSCGTTIAFVRSPDLYILLNFLIVASSPAAKTFAFICTAKIKEVTIIINFLILLFSPPIVTLLLQLNYKARSSTSKIILFLQLKVEVFLIILIS